MNTIGASMTDLSNLLRALAVLCALSISAVSTAELVVYEGTATVTGVDDSFGQFPFTVNLGDEFRFRATVDSSTRPSTNPELVDGLAVFTTKMRSRIWMFGSTMYPYRSPPRRSIRPFSTTSCSCEMTWITRRSTPPKSFRWMCYC